MRNASRGYEHVPRLTRPWSSATTGISTLAMMKSGELVTIPGSLRTFSGILLVSNLAIAVGLYRMLGPGTRWMFLCTLAVGVSVVFLAYAALQGKQRIEITAEGFTSYNLFGKAAQAHPWTDIEGHFAVIRVGWHEAVAYRLTAECKARLGKKPTSVLSGYDEAIPGLFQLSARQIALQFENHRRGIGAAAAANP